MAALVVTRCNGAEVLQPVDRPLDDVAAFVGFDVEPWWRATVASLAQSAFLRIETFRTHTAYPAVLDLLSIMTCAIGAVDAQARRTFARPASGRTRYRDGIENLSKICRITALSSSDDNRQGQTVPINTQVNLAGDAAARSAEPLVSYEPLFSAAGNFLRAPAALR